MADRCEHGNEPSSSKKCGEFLENLRNGLFLNIDCSLELFIWLDLIKVRSGHLVN